jgi:hypothetical protein
MFSTGETNKTFVFASIAIGAVLSAYAFFTLAKFQLSVVG